MKKFLAVALAAVAMCGAQGTSIPLITESSTWSTWTDKSDNPSSGTVLTFTSGETGGALVGTVFMTADGANGGAEGYWPGGSFSSNFDAGRCVNLESIEIDYNAVETWRIDLTIPKLGNLGLNYRASLTPGDKTGSNKVTIPVSAFSKPTWGETDFDANNVVPYLDQVVAVAVVAVSGAEKTCEITVNQITLNLSDTPPPAGDKFTVTLDPNGGSVSPTSVTQSATGASVQLPNPSKGTDTFKGWFTAATGGSQVSSPYTPTGTVTLYAQWTQAPIVAAEYIDLFDDSEIEWEGYKDSFGSDYSIEMPMNPLNATITLVKEDEETETWPSVGIGTYPDHLNFSGLTKVVVTYTSTKPILIGIGSTHKYDDEFIVYQAELPAATTSSTVTINLNQFNAPQWMWDASWGGSLDASLKNLADIASNTISPDVSFALEASDQGPVSVEFTVTSIKLYGVTEDGDDTPIFKGVSKKKAANGLKITGFSAGKLGLNVPTAGSYNIAIYSVDGRVLAQTKANLVNGTNSLAIGKNLARGVAIVRVQGANATLVRKISIR